MSTEYLAERKFGRRDKILCNPMGIGDVVETPNEGKLRPDARPPMNAMELHLNTIKEPLLIFGGPYGNLQATQALKEIAGKASFPPERIICTGDLAAYCAQPSETIALIRDWGIHCIKGNVEEQLAEGLDDCGCNFSSGSTCDRLSQQWYRYTDQEVGDDQRAWLRSLPDHLRFHLNDFECVVVHGALSSINRFVFASTPWTEKEDEIESAKADVIIAGHSGLPFSQSQQGKLWCNAGVIGMPANDGTTRSWYAIIEPLDGGGIKCSHIPFHYPNQEAASLMKQRGLPSEYHETLLSGLWNNCDILPESETLAQGQALSPQATELLPLL